MRDGVITAVVNSTEATAVDNKKKFLQETNFDDESEAFKSDALDNYEKHYGDRKKKLRDMWKNNYES